MTLAQRLQTLNVSLGLNVCRWRATHIAPWMQHLSWRTTGRQSTGYMKPPQEIIDLVDIPPEPNLSFSPDRTKVLQLYKPSPMPPIS